MPPTKTICHILSLSFFNYYRKDYATLSTSNLKGVYLLMQAVINVPTSQLTVLKNAYEGYLSGAPAGAVFRAKIHGTTITGYRSGKVMFQGSNIDSQLNRWQSISVVSSSKKSSNHRKVPVTSLPTDFESWSVLGSDEVGTGSYFGPLTVAAVYVDQNHLEKVKSLGVQDSKKLTDPEIIKMAKQILTFAPYHVVNLMPDKYNQLMNQYHNQGQLKAFCHNLALQKVLQKISPTIPDGILIDQFVAPNTYYRYLKGQKVIVKDGVYFKTKGEQAHLSVAAASIVARYVSLQAMDELTQNAGITLPIGAGNAVDQIAAKLIHRGLPLGNFAKIHFGNTEKAKEIAAQL